MQRYLLDTNILVHYARQSKLYQQVESELNLTAPDAVIMVCVVTKAEILSFAIQNNWGAKKLQSIQTLFSKIITIDITAADNDLLEAYSQMDAFSKGKLPGKALSSSAKSIGKNDLWIAATAKVANAILVTTDNDFDPLNGTFLSVRKYQ